MKIARLYPGSDGDSHFEDIDVAFIPGPSIEHLAAIPDVDGVQIRRTPAGSVWGFHRADCRKYMIILEGRIEIGVGNGAKRTFGAGDVLIVEDTTGRGHTTRVIGDEDRICIDIKLGT